MSQKFDWRSEDDEQWGIEESRDKPVNSTRTRRRRWLMIVVVAFLILIAGLIFSRRLGTHLDETELEADQAILSSNDLVLVAARDGDTEILASLLSGRELIWAAGQLAALEAGLMFDRDPFGIDWQIEEVPVTDITVSPGIDSADVVNHLKYSLAPGSGSSETITLQHQLHYRRSDDRWLLSPPPQDYWGPAVTEEGYYLSISFPERDSIIGKRLAIDLEGLLAALCHLDNVDSCSLAFPLQLRLVADPASIVQFSNIHARLTGTLALELPTPSLFGWPDDETAYQAMYRSYGERVVSAVVAEQIGWECCSKVLIYQALMDQQLARLGLIPSPLTPAHYLQALNHGEPTDFIDLIWIDWHPTAGRMETEEDILAHLLIEYVISDWHGGPIIDLQRNLFKDYTFYEYLAISVPNIDLNAFNDGWKQFLNRRLNSLES